MKKVVPFLFLMCSLIGCESEPSTADSEALKAGLNKPGGPMSDKEKSDYEEYMKKRGMGGAASAPSAPGGK